MGIFQEMHTYASRNGILFCDYRMTKQLIQCLGENLLNDAIMKLHSCPRNFACPAFTSLMAATEAAVISHTKFFS